MREQYCEPRGQDGRYVKVWPMGICSRLYYLKRRVEFSWPNLEHPLLPRQVQGRLYDLSPCLRISASLRPRGWLITTWGCWAERRRTQRRQTQRETKTFTTRSKIDEKRRQADSSLAPLPHEGIPVGEGCFFTSWRG